MPIPTIQTRRRVGIRTENDVAYVIEPVGWHRFILQFGRTSLDGPNTGIATEFSRETPAFLSVTFGSNLFFVCLFGTQDSI